MSLLIPPDAHRLRQAIERMRSGAGTGKTVVGEQETLDWPVTRPPNDSISSTPSRNTDTVASVARMPGERSRTLRRERGRRSSGSHRVTGEAEWPGRTSSLGLNFGSVPTLLAFSIGAESSRAVPVARSQQIDARHERDFPTKPRWRTVNQARGSGFSRSLVARSELLG